jgi:hypothetical protein
MVGKEHHKILKQGIAVWNKWREENYDTRPDLFGILFYGAELLGANLDYVDLESADLTNANLSGATLQHANLKQACLINANLSGVDLYEADLSEANLGRANLSRASFRKTNLRQSNLSEANLSGSIFYKTIFANTMLKDAKNLDSCIHRGPSTLDHQTIVQSGDIPLTFLRGCGLPDSLIEYLPSLLNESPLQFYSCFISYSHKDEEFAKRLHADLQNNGVRCWFAPEDFKIGDKIRSTIDESIRVYDKLLLVLSETSVQSTWVEHEVETALDKEADLEQTVLFPIRLDDTVMDIKIGWAAKIRRERHIGDFRKWKNYDYYQKAFDRLLRDLEAESHSLQK